MKPWLPVALSLGILSCSCWAESQTSGKISLQDALKAAVANSPQIRSAQSRIEAAGHGVRVAESSYFPSIEFDAIDTSGYPGSSDWEDMRGLMASPFRSGLSAGVAARQTLWDFGRTLYGVEIARRLQALSGIDRQIAQLETQQIALNAYYNCARIRSERDSFGYIMSEAIIVEKQTDLFVKTGQISIVDKSLARSQTEKARTQFSGFDAGLAAAENRLAVFTGLPREGLECETLDRISDDFLRGAPPFDERANPLIARADMLASAARSRAARERVENNPTLVAVASAGYLQRSRLVGKENYSVGIGVTLPIFEGFGIQQRTRQFDAEALSREQDVASERQILEGLLDRLDETQRSEQAMLNHLRGEWALAQHALKLAKKRYFTFKGTLVDLREALRNLSDVVVRLNETLARLGAARGERSLLMTVPR